MLSNFVTNKPIGSLQDRSTQKITTKKKIIITLVHLCYVDVVQSYNVFNVDNTIASEWTLLHKDAFIGCREVVPYR